MANQYGSTGSGFVLPTLQDIEFDVQTEMLNSLPNLSFDEGKVETGLSEVMTRLSYCMWQAIYRSHNQGNPNFVSGCELNALAARNGVYRIDGETDSELRVRLNAVISGSSGILSGSSCFDNLYRDLFSINGVTDVQVNLNDTPNQQGTLPPNSYEVMVIGGDSDSIGQAIWNNHPVGISHVGNTSFQITDCSGICRDVYFTRPKIVPIYLDIRVRRTQAICGCPTDNTDVICEAIYNYIQEDGGSCFTRIGQPLHVQEFFAPIFNIQGLGITCALMSRDGLCADNEMVTLKRDEVPFFNKECINVEFTNENSSPCATGNYSCPSDACTFSLDILKEADVSEFVSEGDTINYTYTVTNISSGIIISPISITDDKVTVTCNALPAGGLPVGDSVTCTATYVATYDDAIAGFVTNKAQAVAGTLISPCVEVTVPYTGPELFHAMELKKVVVSGSCENIGDVLTYQYTVKNTGTVPIITQPIISDDKIGSIICPPIPANGLLPNSSVSATAQTIVTQQILDAGECCNSARASAASPLGNVVSNVVTVCVECGEDSGNPTVPSCPSDQLVDCAVLPVTIGGFSNVTNITTSPASPSHTFTYNSATSELTIDGEGVNEVVLVTAINNVTGEECEFEVSINGCGGMGAICPPSQTILCEDMPVTITGFTGATSITSSAAPDYTVTPNAANTQVVIDTASAGVGGDVSITLTASNDDGDCSTSITITGCESDGTLTNPFIYTSCPPFSEDVLAGLVVDNSTSPPTYLLDTPDTSNPIEFFSSCAGSITESGGVITQAVYDELLLTINCADGFTAQEIC